MILSTHGVVGAGPNMFLFLTVLLGIVSQLLIMSSSDINQRSALTAERSLRIHSHYSSALRILNTPPLSTADRPDGTG